ncbi:MAG: thiamine phosphate synthase [Pseudomonadota bacterium]
MILTLSPDRFQDLDIIALANTGLIASCILYPGEATAQNYATYCEKWVPKIQATDIAALIADDTQVLGRSGADGLMITENAASLSEAIKKFSPKHIIGCGGLKTRDAAMIAGESKPDFVFFGSPGDGKRKKPHPKDFEIAEWWSGVIEIPCVMMAGNTIDSVMDCARTGADFIAIESVLFSDDAEPVAILQELNARLDAEAPRFEEANA